MVKRGAIHKVKFCGCCWKIFFTVDFVVFFVSSLLLSALCCCHGWFCCRRRYLVVIVDIAVVFVLFCCRCCYSWYCCRLFLLLYSLSCCRCLLLLFLSSSSLSLSSLLTCCHYRHCFAVVIIMVGLFFVVIVFTWLSSLMSIVSIFSQFFYQNWKKRWFVLQKNLLKYYSDRKVSVILPF